MRSLRNEKRLSGFLDSYSQQKNRVTSSRSVRGILCGVVSAAHRQALKKSGWRGVSARNGSATSALRDSGYVNLHKKVCAKSWVRICNRYRLPNAANCTLLQSYPNGGSSSIVSLGWRRVGNYGKTANE